MMAVLISILSQADTLQSSNFEILETPAGNSNSFVVFINLNTSEIELDALRAIAKQNGFGLVTIPNSATMNAMTTDYADYKLQGCDSEDPHPTSACKSLDNKLIEAAGKYAVDLNRDLPAALQAVQGAKINSLVISGHNTDNGFSGDYLVPKDYNHGLITQTLKKYADLNPQLFAELQFLGLWGCDTVKLPIVNTYKAALPKIGFVAGYGDTAPSGVRQISGDYLASVWEHSAALRQVDSKATLGDRIQSIDEFNKVYGSIWVHTESIGTYLYRRSSTGTTFDQVASRLSRF
jgi:hypothetical protein